MSELNNELLKYLNKDIEPLYNKFLSHGSDHINLVIDQSLLIAKDYDVNINMVYTIACYHDLGLIKGRNNHEETSGMILATDKNLRDFFSDDEIITMKEAVEDHRGSRKITPRSIYGMIISDADRDTSVEILSKRQLPTSIKYYPELKTFEEHFDRCYNYILSRANNNFEFNLWTGNKIMCNRMEKFAKVFMDKEATRKIYYNEYKIIEENNLFSKIQNEYLD